MKQEAYTGKNWAIPQDHIGWSCGSCPHDVPGLDLSAATCDRLAERDGRTTATRRTPGGRSSPSCGMDCPGRVHLCDRYRTIRTGDAWLPVAIRSRRSGWRNSFTQVQAPSPQEMSSSAIVLLAVPRNRDGAGRAQGRQVKPGSASRPPRPEGGSTLADRVRLCETREAHRCRTAMDGKAGGRSTPAMAGWVCPHASVHRRSAQDARFSRSDLLHGYVYPVGLTSSASAPASTG
jgi:hypothetical protein